MRHFASSGLRLWNLPREAKIIYTFFCAFSQLALLSSLLLYGEVSGGAQGGLQRVRAYYGAAAPARSSAETARGAPPAVAGPAIDLPDEAVAAPAAGALTVAVPYRKLLEVTHFHLFTVPIFLLIITHLFVMTGLSRRSKTAWVVLGWSSAALHIATPWLVRLGGAAVLFPVSGAGLLLSGVVLTGYPLIALWRPASRPRGRPDAGAPPATASPPDRQA